MTAKSPETAERILAAARELFLEHNYADVPVDRIAGAAEVTKGGLYHHFASKEKLYLAMLHANLGRLRALFLEAPEAPAAHQAARRGRPRVVAGSGEGLPPPQKKTAPGACRERLGRLTRAFLLLPPVERRVIGLVRRDINTFSGPERAELIESYQRALPRLIEEIIREGIERGEITRADPRLLSWSYVAQVEVALTPYADSLFEDVESRLDFVLDRFFHGTLPLSQETTA
jgi:AcrR family transcriptional regulator